MGLFSDKKIENKKVKLVAVAKDEAAYLLEWVHHHLFFGFDEIEVYVNRTSDNSLDILSSISKKFSSVKYYQADWVDLCPEGARQHIQQIIYSMALNRAREENFDYVMFLDVDEFFWPVNLTDTIKTKLLELKHPDSISFQWFNEKGSNKLFSPLMPRIEGFKHKLVKSIVRVSADIDSMSLHLPRFKGGRKLLSDGEKFVAANGHHEQLHPKLSKVRDVMIVHRMFRSPMEYASLLSRGRPSKTRLTIKTNRFGYNVDNSDADVLSSSDYAYKKYRASYSEFFEKTQLAEELETARVFVKDRYRQTLKSIENIPIESAKEALRAFRYCDEEVVKALNKKYGTKTFVNSVSTPILLAELARMFIAIDNNTAKLLITRAIELHPTGPQIGALHREIFSSNV